MGKTSIVRRYTENAFSDKEVSTVQGNMFNKKKLQINDKMYSISVWDTAGQERFHALGPIYYRDANGALLVFDLTDADTLQKVKVWIKELKQVVGEDIALVVAGNKCDLEKNRQVAADEAIKYCKQVGAEFVETSAKSGKGVQDAFYNLTQKMVDIRDKGHTGGAGGGGSNGGGSKGRRRLDTSDWEEAAVPTSKKEKSKGGCC